MSDRLNSMWAAQQTTKIILLCLKTVKSGSNKVSLPIDPFHEEGHCQLPPLEGSLAQVSSSLGALFGRLEDIMNSDDCYFLCTESNSLLNHHWSSVNQSFFFYYLGLLTTVLHVIYPDKILSTNERARNVSYSERLEALKRSSS